jgi:hypothetical protein
VSSRGCPIQHPPSIGLGGRSIRTLSTHTGVETVVDVSRETTYVLGPYSLSVGNTRPRVVSDLLAIELEALSHRFEL